jgi:hypothetical protein
MCTEMLVEQTANPPGVRGGNMGGTQGRATIQAVTRAVILVEAVRASGGQAQRAPQFFDPFDSDRRRWSAFGDGECLGSSG